MRPLKEIMVRRRADMLAAAQVFKKGENIMEETINWNCDPAADERGGVKEFTLPKGEYTLTVWDVMKDDKGRLIGKTQKGDPKINLRLGINGQGGEKWVYHTVSFIGKDKPGHFIAVHAMKCLGVNIEKGALVNFRPTDLVGRVCRAELDVEEYDTLTARGNQVKRKKNVIKNMLYPQSGDQPELPTAKAPAQPKADGADMEVPF